jgi:protein SCO1/2
VPARLAEMRKRYGVVAEKIAAKQPNAYGMNHSTSVWLIDRTGKLRAMMPYGHEAKDFVHDLKLLLASK